MIKEITIEQFRHAIKQLPSDKPKTQPGVWYKTQKEHWLGWLSEYNGSGAYGRKIDKSRDAKYAYNHIVNYKMLIWVIKAAGVDRTLVKKALSVIDERRTYQENAGAIRKIVPWEVIAKALWRTVQ